MREYTATNRERVNAQRRARYHASPERARAAQRDYAARPEVQTRTREYNRAYVEANRAAITAQRASYRASTKEQKREADHAYRVANLPAIKAAARARYEANRQAVIDRNREWRRRHPERILAKNQRRRARMADVPVEHVSAAAIYARDNGLCGICRQPVSREQFSLDHIVPLALGGAHVEANLQSAHRSCNSRKGAKPAVTAAA